MNRSRNKSINRCATRRGLAAVEFAVIAPVIVFLLISAIEVSRAIGVQHNLQEAAQAGCRLYSLKEASQQQAVDLINQSLQEAGISGYTLTFTPETKAEILQNMQMVTVEVSVPHSQVAWITPMFLRDAVMAGRCTFPADMGDINSDDGLYNETDDDNLYDGIPRDDDPVGAGSALWSDQGLPVNY